VTGSASFPRSGGAPTTNAQPTTGTISYDAANRSYTITVQGRSLTFLPGDIDAASTTQTLTVYKRTDGSTSDSLTLTNPGDSGRFTYRYVGGAFWQRSVERTSTIDGSFDAFAYGVRSPAAAVPRTGRAEYVVDLVGVESLADNVAGVTGQGTMQVDFASGAISTVGTMAAPISGNTVFSSEARLASAANAFSGTFRYADFGEFSGTLNGAFYGPGAEEVGAGYSARQGDGRVAVGVLIGRRSGSGGSNSSITSLTASEFLSNDAARLSTTLTGRSGSNETTGTFSASGAAPSALAVSYDANLKSYSLIAPERSQYFGPERPGGTFRADRSQGTTTEELSFPTPTYPTSVPNWDLVRNLQYVRAARWLIATPGGTGATSYAITDFAFGIRTPDGAVPRTGSGGFVIAVSGIAADASFPNLVHLSGAGTALVDFGRGTMTGSGRMDFREDYFIAGRAGGSATGSFSLEASLASAANGFAGTMRFTGIGDYSGPLSGRFHGPAAEELGASFSATDGIGGGATGSILGRRDPSMTAPVPTLRTMSGSTQLSALSVANPANGNIQTAYFTYDADSRTYAYFPSNPTNAAAVAYRFGPAQAVASGTDATYSAYAGSGPAGQFNASDTFTASLLNPTPDNPRIALTYTSFADVTVRSGSQSERQWVIFGIVPPDSQLPRTGTGSYSGIVFGHGDRGGSPLDVNGTATLSVDFAAQSFRSQLALSTSAAGANAFSPLALVDYTGTASRGLLMGNVADPSAQGRLQGQLFGPNAAEFGLLFSYSRFFPDAGRYNIVGGAVGKRD
jgi:hypothetical protein